MNPTSPLTHVCSGETCLVARELKVNYDKVAAVDIKRLEIQGSLICVIGHNGSGKSTLLKTILDLLPIKSGSLHIESVVNHQRHTLVPVNDMAFSPENGSVFADITVESYISLWCRIKLKDPKYYLTSSDHYIERLGIGSLLRKKGSALSKGEKRKVQTYIGFLINPKLFLLDEPFDGLDIVQASKFADLIREESLRRNFVITSHRMSIVERLASNILVLNRGQLAVSGTPEEVCRELAPTTYAVTVPEMNIEHRHLLAQRLQAELNDSAVTTISNQIIVASSALALEELARALGELEVQKFEITPVNASLGEAMTHHLRSITYDFSNTFPSPASLSSP